jgi:hypothetical protein
MLVVAPTGNSVAMEDSDEDKPGGGGSSGPGLSLVSGCGCVQVQVGGGSRGRLFSAWRCGTDFCAVPPPGRAWGCRGDRASLRHRNLRCRDAVDEAGA